MKKQFTHPALDEPIMCDFRFEVCPTCSGHGHHFGLDLDESRLVESMEEDGDDEGLDAYSKNQYNVRCTECHGERVVEVAVLPAEAAQLISEYHELERQDRRYAEQERRMGA